MKTTVPQSITDQEIRLRNLGPYRFILAIAFRNRTTRANVADHMTNFMFDLAVNINEKANFPYGLPLSGAIVVPRPNNKEGDPMTVYAALRDHPLLPRPDDNALFDFELCVYSSMVACFPRHDSEVTDIRAELLDVDIEKDGSNKILRRLLGAATSNRAIFQI
jgi:hypothetical protein